MFEDLLSDYLYHYHSGERNIISSRELEATFRIRGSELRRMINHLRADGIPICSTDKGYFYAETNEELERTIRQLQSRIKKIARAEHGLVKALERRTNSNQITFPLEGGDTD